MLAVPAQRRATTCTAVTWTAPDAGGAMTEADTPAAAQPDAELVAQLRAGDAAAFRFIVKNWSPAMLHLARTFVSTHASAEEMVQETWLAVIKGLDRFEGRSTLRTWVFHVLANIARRRGVQESRVMPWSLDTDDGLGPTVDPARFRGPEDKWAGGFRADSVPRAWGPEAGVLSAEIRIVLLSALEQLPLRQRTVVALRDVDGLTSDEVCDLLDLSAANQRVLLHRARARLRELLEDYHYDSAEVPA
jgi:RNA polymerase sigma-70 factor, ECF subfamily